MGYDIESHCVSCFMFHVSCFMFRIAINGFGRIGRAFLRKSFNNPNFKVVAINDLGEIDNLAYLLKYDTVYGMFNSIITTDTSDTKQYLVISTPPGPNNTHSIERKILMFSEKDPSKLPWKDLNIDVVVESTGVFETLEKSEPHIDAGAKRVVISAPAKDDMTPTATPNVGIDQLVQQLITSNASCTTNAVSPLIAILTLNPGVKKAILNTVHGYTATQSIVDGPVKGGDYRRGRAAAQNIIPSSTGAAIATTRALPHLKNKFDGIAIRVPVVSGSIIDLTFVSERLTSVDEINNIFKEKALSNEWKDILAVTQEPLVSSDILGNTHGSIVDLSMTRVVDGDLIKILAWYDNEWGYVSMLEKHIETVILLL